MVLVTTQSKSIVDELFPLRSGAVVLKVVTACRNSVECRRCLVHSVGGDNAEPLSRIGLNIIENELKTNSCGTFGPIVKDRT